ncbi:hypothetical protein RND81_14G083300 [Saponaria officinalis]|uniref:Replication factor A C-terminal domain-containing protein n=1 Tax=Saponaria officinalis TaxID=3572 RepID=A0AAW1GKL2_SAPOF
MDDFPYYTLTPGTTSSKRARQICSPGQPIRDGASQVANTRVRKRAKSKAVCIREADVIGVVIYMEEKARTMITAQQKQLSVREIVIADHSVEQLLVISAWHDLAEVDCDSLSAWSGKLEVVGFTALRVSAHRGFSLTTTMSTTIIHSPQGERADGLREWVGKHRKLLTDMQNRVVDVRKSGNDQTIKKIATLKMKKAQTTLQDERHWLLVTIPAELNQINAYLGCSNCGKRADMPAGHVYSCTACSAENIKCSPKITFNTDVSDGSGTLSITTFTVDAIKLFRMDAADIFKMKHSEDHETFKQIKELMHTVPVLIQVGPKATLSRNNVLQWVLKQVVIDEETPSNYGSGKEQGGESSRKCSRNNPTNNVEQVLQDGELPASVGEAAQLVLEIGKATQTGKGKGRNKMEISTQVPSTIEPEYAATKLQVDCEKADPSNEDSGAETPVQPVT